MKKVVKIILIVIAITISALIIFGINELSKYTTYNAEITEIEGKRIIVKDTYNNEYQLYTNNIKIKNNKGQTIDNLDLNIE